MKYNTNCSQKSNEMSIEVNAVVYYYSLKTERCIRSENPKISAFYMVDKAGETKPAREETG